MMTSTTVVVVSEQQQDRPPCYYRSPSSNNSWRRRWELSELKIGQELPDAIVVQELLHGKTGPKLFCEVGVGRCRQQQWKMVNAMLRLGFNSKQSVVQKRAARLRKKKLGFPVYVSKIRLDNDQLEVTLDREQFFRAGHRQQQQQQRVSISSLQVGQIVQGTVIRVEPYGVLVDVGANRHGLLHINKVADWKEKFIDKEKGLQEAGLSRGTKVTLQVHSNTHKRLFLDFSNEAKKQKEESQQSLDQSFQTTNQPENISAVSSKSPSQATTSARGSSAATYSQPKVMAESKDEEDNGEEVDDYDEDREIEDAFGLGTY